MMHLLGLFYVGLWITVGATCGFLSRYGLAAQKKGPPYYKAWFMYTIGMSFCFGALNSIYEIHCIQLLGNSWEWVGMAALVISFFTSLYLGFFRGRLP